MSFAEIFPPSLDPINAGFLSMAEDDIHNRVIAAATRIEDGWGKILPSRDIIDNALADAGLDPWMLSPKDFAILDYFDIVED